MNARIWTLAMAAACCFAWVSPGAAVTFTDTKKADPFAAGKTCRTPEVMSYGSYVYQWPSKYDAVFSPWVDPGFVWTCPASGFVTLASEFDKIPAEQKARIDAWLKANPAKLETLTEDELYDRMEATYVARGMDDEFWRYFYRVRANWAETAAQGDAYRAKALPLLKAQVAAGKLKPGEHAQTLYLIGYYSTRAGDAAGAAEAFGAIGRIDWRSQSAEKNDLLSYFNGLVADVKAGKLDGECAQHRPETCASLRAAIANAEAEMTDPVPADSGDASDPK